MIDWRTAPTPAADHILHTNGIADVRRMPWGKPGFEVCITKPGATYSVRVGFGENLHDCIRTADKLAAHPRQAFDFAGIKY